MLHRQEGVAGSPHSRGPAMPCEIVLVRQARRDAARKESVL